MLKKEDLIKGEIYKYNKIEITRYPSGLNLNTSSNVINKCIWLWTLSIEEVTPEEKHWFLECEKAGIFVDKNTALKSFKEDYTGRYIKALVDYPDSGKVLKGEIGKFIDNGFYADFPSHKCYACSNWRSMTKEYELLPIDYNPEQISNNQSKFEVGKWYKNPGTFPGAAKTYGKFLKWENGKWYFSDYINNGKIDTKESFWSYGNSNKVYESLTDLSEIQQYLPEGHVDLIIKEQTVKSSELTSLPEKWCIKSNKNIIKIIADFWDNSLYLNKIYSSADNIRHYENHYFHSHNLSGGQPFGKNGGSNHVSKTCNSTEITFEQFKKWVLVKDNSMEDLLIEAKRRYPIGTKFNCANNNSGGDCVIVNHNLFKYLNSGSTIGVHQGNYWIVINDKWAEIVTDNISIPEYIESTENYNGYFQKGIIYKVRNFKNIYSVEMVTNIEIDNQPPESFLYVNLIDNNYKSSTKEAYDRQELLKQGNDLHKNYFEPSEETWIPKVGDWIYIETTEQGAYGANNSIAIVIPSTIKASGLSSGICVEIQYYIDTTKEVYSKFWFIGKNPIIRKATQQEIDNHLFKFDGIKEPFYNKVQEEKENYLYVSNEDILLSNKVNDTTSIIVPLYEPDDVVLL